jgi:CubicO group peptidase (beta-lactamase class C family)
MAEWGRPAVTALEAGFRGLLEGSGLARSPTIVAVATRGAEGPSLACGSVAPGVAMTMTTPMYGASLTKQMVGILLAELVAEGRVDARQSVREILPELPPWSAAIQLDHLIHHTSGLPDAAQLCREMGLPAGVEGERQWTNAWVLEALGALGTAARPPGLRLEYSGVGYICLAEVVERVSGEALAERARQRLFLPLAMVDSRLGAPAEATPVPAPRPPSTLGDGGLWTTASDLSRWNRAMNARRLGEPVHKLAESTGFLADGTPLDYAWGIRVTRRAGSRAISHGGSWPGWTSKAIRQPDIGTSVVLLTTSADIMAVNDVAWAIADGVAEAQSAGT